MTSAIEVVKGVLSEINDYDYVRKLLDSYLEIFSKEYESRGNLRELDPSSKYVVVGDIHGDYATLTNILSKVNIESLSKGDTRLVFLGDIIDRGQHQLECLLMILELKLRYPDSVMVLRGNHEPPEYLKPYPHDFPDELIIRYGYTQGNELYRGFLKLFDYMPLVAIVKKEFVALHGGLPTTTYQKAGTIYEYFLGISEDQKRKLVEEILWNDPIEANIVSSPSPRGAGYLFGSKVSEWFVKRFKVKVVVRGHEPVERGFKFNHGGRVLTLFSRLGPPYFNSSAAYLVLDLGAKEWWRRLQAFIKIIHMTL